mgnify:CR=1 FL=1
MATAPLHNQHRVGGLNARNFFRRGGAPSQAGLRRVHAHTVILRTNFLPGIGPSGCNFLCVSVLMRVVFIYQRNTRVVFGIKTLTQRLCTGCIPIMIPIKPEKTKIKPSKQTSKTIHLSPSPPSLPPRESSPHPLYSPSRR